MTAMSAQSASEVDAANPFPDLPVPRGPDARPQPPRPAGRLPAGSRTPVSTTIRGRGAGRAGPRLRCPRARDGARPTSVLRTPSLPSRGSPADNPADHGHVSIDQTLHYVGVDQEEMAEGFAVFDQHMRANYSDLSMSASQRQTAF